MPKCLDEKDSNQDGDKEEQQSVTARTMSETDRPLAARRAAERSNERNQCQSDAFESTQAPRTFEGHRTRGAMILGPQFLSPPVWARARATKYRQRA